MQIGPLVVTAVGGPISSLEGAIYAAQPDRSAAIRIVEPFVPPVSPGDQITVYGKMGTSAEGEREILADSIVKGSPVTPLNPLFMPIKNLGGASPDANTNGVENATVLYNSGNWFVCADASSTRTMRASSFTLTTAAVEPTALASVYYPVPTDGSEIPPNGVYVTGLAGVLWLGTPAGNWRLRGSDRNKQSEADQRPQSLCQSHHHRRIHPGNNTAHLYVGTPPNGHNCRKRKRSSVPERLKCAH